VPFELAASVEEATALVRERFRESGLTLALEMDSRLPAYVTGDRVRIRQLLSNLLDNALKFTPQGGVTVRVGLKESAAHLAKIRFEVEDTGIGVPPDESSTVFEKFARLDNPINRAQGGTGLGLAICKQLVEQMGGELGVYQRPGGGSVFWFSLNLPVEGQPRKDATAGNELKSLKVLVVEDNEIAQEMVVTMLRKLGCNPQVARNGQTALDLTSKLDFPVILMDCRLPDMDGRDACASIRKIMKPGESGPIIIAMTAQLLDQDRESCLAAGMNDCLWKPFSFEDLREVLQRCIRSAKACSYPTG
jgi:CheY-like chemotaxis protein